MALAAAALGAGLLLADLLLPDVYLTRGFQAAVIAVAASSGTALVLSGAGAAILRWLPWIAFTSSWMDLVRFEIAAWLRVAFLFGSFAAASALLTGALNGVPVRKLANGIRPLVFGALAAGACGYSARLLPSVEAAHLSGRFALLLMSGALVASARP